MRNTRVLFDQWLGFAGMDAELKSELIGCANDPDAIADRFYKDLEFGTGGLRGIIGAGTNRMNRYTVARATRGLAAYLMARCREPSCAIAYDSRNKSRDFAETAAAVLAALGVRVHMFEDIMPTPILSFAVRQLRCSAGIVITASHNPAAYNGYKVYGDDGGQIVTGVADQISAHISREKDLAHIPDSSPFMGDRIRPVGADVLEAYDAKVAELLTETPRCGIRVVYSPLNGAGNKPVRALLSRLGYVRTVVVPEQEHPDGDFPTCPYPNPEEPEAMRLASELMLHTGADLCLATDPDSDRIGVGVPHAGKTRLLSGNEMGVLLFEYICWRHTRNGTMPKDPVAVKTIVTTDMAAKIAEAYGVRLINVLTGFKYIGEQIGILESASQQDRYLFGFEESFGYLAGTFVRDKDAVSTAGLICEMAAHHKSNGKTLPDALEALSRQFGYFAHALVSFAFPGVDGMRKMETAMNDFRHRCPPELAGRSVTHITDYLRDNPELPPSNVLALSLGDSCKVILRPSGTEPKLKIYLSSSATSEPSATQAIEALKREMKDRLSRSMTQ